MSRAIREGQLRRQGPVPGVVGALLDTYVPRTCRPDAANLSPTNIGDMATRWCQAAPVRTDLPCSPDRVRPAKEVRAQVLRGFKSHPLRWSEARSASKRWLRASSIPTRMPTESSHGTGAVPPPATCDRARRLGPHGLAMQRWRGATRVRRYEPTAQAPAPGPSCTRETSRAAQPSANTRPPKVPM